MPIGWTYHVIRYSAEGDFWDAIRDIHWQREPLAFRVEPADSPFSPHAVFSALTADAPRDPLDWIQLSVTDAPTDLRSYRLATFRHFGPQQSDGDFEGYFARLGGRSFGANVHDLGRRNPALQQATKPFRERLNDLPGSPVVHRWEIDAFFGNYPATPFGIHRDNGGVFSFCLYGRRSYLLWPPEYFHPGHPDLTRPDPDLIARHADAATRIDVKPGLGVYWPSNRWHVVLSDGAPFAVAQVSAYFDHADLGIVR